MTRYFRRQWDEDPGFEPWGASTWWFAARKDGSVMQQVATFENGYVLAYDESHTDDEHGGLSDQPQPP